MHNSITKKQQVMWMAYSACCRQLLPAASASSKCFGLVCCFESVLLAVLAVLAELYLDGVCQAVNCTVNSISLLGQSRLHEQGCSSQGHQHGTASCRAQYSTWWLRGL